MAADVQTGNGLDTHIALQRLLEMDIRIPRGRGAYE